MYVSDRTANNVTFYGPPTTPGPPLVFSESATNVNDTGATLNTTIVPFGLDTTCQFQYVDDAAFQSTGYATATSVPCVPPDLGSSFTFQSASATITGLTTQTVYHFRAVATNSEGTVNGADKTFQTSGPAIVVTQPATNITATDATLNGTVNPNGLDTTCMFQYVDDADFQTTGYDHGDERAVQSVRRRLGLLAGVRERGRERPHAGHDVSLPRGRDERGWDGERQ